MTTETRHIFELIDNSSGGGGGGGGGGPAGPGAPGSGSRPRNKTDQAAPLMIGDPSRTPPKPGGDAAGVLKRMQADQAQRDRNKPAEEKELGDAAGVLARMQAQQALRAANAPDPTERREASKDALGVLERSRMNFAGRSRLNGLTDPAPERLSPPPFGATARSGTSRAVSRMNALAAGSMRNMQGIALGGDALSGFAAAAKAAGKVSGRSGVLMTLLFGRGATLHGATRMLGLLGAGAGMGSLAAGGAIGLGVAGVAAVGMGAVTQGNRLAPFLPAIIVNKAAHDIRSIQREVRIAAEFGESITETSRVWNNAKYLASGAWSGITTGFSEEFSRYTNLVTGRGVTSYDPALFSTTFIKIFSDSLVDVWNGLDNNQLNLFTNPVSGPIISFTPNYPDVPMPAEIADGRGKQTSIAKFNTSPSSYVLAPPF